MSLNEKLVPTSSQTVGPYFRIGLEYLTERASRTDAGVDGTIEIKGRVLDRDGAAVSDAMLEFWSAADRDGVCEADANGTGCPDHFRRVATDIDGCFSVVISRPSASPFDEQQAQAPYAVVLLFARGLLRHLISRVYFENESGNDSDPVLLSVGAERRKTLIARRQGETAYRWDVVLQGADETVFFAW